MEYELGNRIPWMESDSLNHEHIRGSGSSANLYLDDHGAHEESKRGGLKWLSCHTVKISRVGLEAMSSGSLLNSLMAGVGTFPFQLKHNSLLFRRFLHV